MAAATISPITLAGGRRGPDHMIASSTPSGTAGKSRFRMARERRELTQQQVADRCELSLKTIKRYDAGGRPRSIEIAQRLAEVLEQPLDWLWPPEANLNVRVARANYPAPPPATPPAIPDPHEVLATLHQTRPHGRRPHARLLAPAIALVAAAVVTIAVVLATTEHERPVATQSGAVSRGGIAPTLGAAAPPLLAARAVDRTNGPRASERDPKQRSHRASSRRDASSSQKRAGHPSGESRSAATPRPAQPTSTEQQSVAPRATTNVTSTVLSSAAKRQPASAGCEFPPC
jgi:transcriptional regulator with XRE-family HTH domain